MSRYRALAAVSLIALATPALADTAAPAPAADQDNVTTGVAKGRDRLDSATSTSVLREAEIAKLAPRSVGELLRDIPGILAEAPNGESIANITIRGLPLSSSGAKFVQLQEDGLPVMEFGDVVGASADSFLRLDLNLAQVEAIRGGSASTFASNAPGGIINFISKTGEQEGGAIALTAGVDFDQYRADVDYGGRLSETLRFHIGGYYRQGEGPRRIGFDGQRGGQIKANVTRQFAGGYIRLYGKYLDDRSPFYDSVPLRVTGTNDAPTLAAVPGFDPTKDTLSTRYLQSVLVLDENNQPIREDIRNGQHVKERAFGVESQFALGDWTITERFRAAGRSGGLIGPFSSQYLTPAAALTRLGATGGSFRYATGAHAGQAIADPAALNGNGLIAIYNIRDRRQQDVGSITNDIRASRVWNVGDGVLTTTAGLYTGRQQIDTSILYGVAVTEVKGGGDAALLNVVDAGGNARTAGGIYAYNPLSGTQRRTLRLAYAINAPFASANYKIGRVSIGGSLRYDVGSAKGTVYGVELGGGRIGQVARDIDGDGVISPPEQRVGVTPGAPGYVDYSYRYLSYSGGVVYRVAEPLAVFARYSRGARANADRITFGSVIDNATGALAIPQAAYDPVRQAEIGVKYRHQGVTLNLTGFHVEAQDSNINTSTGAVIARDYKAKGLEFEGGVRRGAFSLTAGATFTDATIVRDRVDPAINGNTPRHQASVIFQATPQVSTDRFAVGAVFIGTTDTYAQDTNLLKIPGYVTTNAFVQVRPAERLLLSLNATNLFDTLALTGIDEDRIPASGIVRGRLLNGRAVSVTARFDF
ncbi:TonB-dependent receptor [Sphingomonas ginsenosidimutans]|jgi:outer membrane receptor protein involved in Fe transport|uniref:TonB-dependent receptor n=1 Tax=Sphingomonas ginsenosidimutans TaxID=862134 RepID=A0A2A4HXJ8_9SPHN|nr:TonB-dependent receptor [Sphingomonas ginsenosidimutans]PCG09256.1 TonB-dependent receptor [Sphingomonas ginsenosidimutans]